MYNICSKRKLIFHGRILFILLFKFYLLYFRVNYDPENWLKISASLLKDHKLIHRVNRAQILDDSLTLARAGLLDYSIALGTTEYLAKELEYIPWIAAIGELTYIGSMLGRESGYGEYKKFLIQQLLPIYEHLGFENKKSDDAMDIKLRAQVISILCNLGYDDCEKKAMQLFNDWKSSSSKF
jgi:aminopeptidase N